MAERQILDDARGIRLVHEAGLGQVALALGALGGEEVPARGMPTNDLAAAVILKRLATAFLVLLREIGFGMGGRKVVTGGEMANYFWGRIWKAGGAKARLRSSVAGGGDPGGGTLRCSRGLLFLILIIFLIVPIPDD